MKGAPKVHKRWDNNCAHHSFNNCASRKMEEIELDFCKSASCHFLGFALKSNVEPYKGVYHIHYSQELEHWIHLKGYIILEVYE